MWRRKWTAQLGTGPGALGDQHAPDAVGRSDTNSEHRHAAQVPSWRGMLYCGRRRCWSRAGREQTAALPIGALAVAAREVNIYRMLLNAVMHAEKMREPEAECQLRHFSWPAQVLKQSVAEGASAPPSGAQRLELDMHRMLADAIKNATDVAALEAIVDVAGPLLNRVNVHAALYRMAHLCAPGLSRHVLTNLTLSHNTVCNTVPTQSLCWPEQPVVRFSRCRACGRVECMPRGRVGYPSVHLPYLPHRGLRCRQYFWQ